MDGAAARHRVEVRISIREAQAEGVQPLPCRWEQTQLQLIIASVSPQTVGSYKPTRNVDTEIYLQIKTKMDLSNMPNIFMLKDMKPSSKIEHGDKIYNFNICIIKLNYCIGKTILFCFICIFAYITIATNIKIKNKFVADGYIIKDELSGDYFIKNISMPICGETNLGHDDQVVVRILKISKSLRIDLNGRIISMRSEKGNTNSSNKCNTVFLQVEIKKLEIATKIKDFKASGARARVTLATGYHNIF